MDKALVNRVEKSGIISIDLSDYFPNDEIESFNLKDFLVNDLMLMEKTFREQLKSHEWGRYKGKVVGIHCSNDALIPMWAYMLVTTYLEPVAKKVLYGDRTYVETELMQEAIKNMDVENFRDGRVVIKGCGDKSVQEIAFIEITKKLKPVVTSIMYGEPCSTVPVYKRQVKGS